MKDKINIKDYVAGLKQALSMIGVEVGYTTEMINTKGNLFMVHVVTVAGNEIYRDLRPINNPENYLEKRREEQAKYEAKSQAVQAEIAETEAIIATIQK